MGLSVVDLESASVVEDVRRACEEIGFLVIAGHGVDPELVAQVGSLSREFFDLPTEEKLRFRDGDFEPLFDDRASSPRIINYPEVESPQDDGQLRAGAHREYILAKATQAFA